MNRIFIVNGISGSGKDTFIEYVGKSVQNVVSISYVDLIKTVAKKLGWNNDYSNEGRKFLSKLVEAVDNYNDYIFDDVCNKIDVRTSRAHTYFVVVRDPKNIARFKNRYGKKCKAIFIERNGLKIPDNDQDRSVLGYKYDIIIQNNSDLNNLKQEANEFIRKYIKTLKRIRHK